MNGIDYLEKISKQLEKIEKSLKEILSIIKNYDEPYARFEINPESEDSENIMPPEAWVVIPYNQCIMTMPPKYISSIYHYHDDSGLNIKFLERGMNSKIFLSEKLALEYCESLGTEHEIIDIPNPKTIVIGDDYE